MIVIERYSSNDEFVVDGDKVPSLVDCDSLKTPEQVGKEARRSGIRVKHK